MSESLNLDSLYSELINSEMYEVCEYIITTTEQILAKLDKKKPTVYDHKEEGLLDLAECSINLLCLLLEECGRETPDNFRKQIVTKFLDDIKRYIKIKYSLPKAMITQSQDNEKSKSKFFIDTYKVHRYRWKNQVSQEFLEELEPWLLNWLKN